jgi:hypothetical protein
MRVRLSAIALVAAACMAGGVAAAQTPQAASAVQQAGEKSPARNRVLGEVTKIDAPNKQVSVKTIDGAQVVVNLAEHTVYRRVPPGETTLDKAVGISLADIGVGDRVIARGKFDEARESKQALSVVVMSKAEITSKQEHDRAEWLRRGVTGVVTALDPQKKEITLRAASGESGVIKIDGAAAGAHFRRYAPDSVKFRDAKPSSFAELKVGDQLRALGGKSADGTVYTPEEVVSGTFRTFGGVVAAVNTSAGELTVTDAQTQKPVVVAVTQDSMLRRLPRELVKDLVRLASRPADADAAGAVGDLQDRLEGSPTVSFGDLKPGDSVLVSGAAGTDPSRVTAVMVSSGVEELVKRLTKPGRPLVLGLGLPNGSL